MRHQVSQSSHAYSLIKERITSGAMPPGVVVSEASLAKELGFSRTPVGDALRQLSLEGLVDQIPRFGTVVREISTEELGEAFEIREALESMAAAKAAQTISEDALAELELLIEAIETEIASVAAAGLDSLRGDSLKRFLSADMAFHMLIIASANNRKLSELLQQSRSLSSMFDARRGEHAVDRVVEANRCHREIVEALRKRDSDRARELVVGHVRYSRQHTFRAPPKESPKVSLGSINLPKHMREDLKAVKR